MLEWSFSDFGWIRCLPPSYGVFFVSKLVRFARV